VCDGLLEALDDAIVDLLHCLDILELFRWLLKSSALTSLFALFRLDQLPDNRAVTNTAQLLVLG